MVERAIFYDIIDSFSSVETVYFGHVQRLSPQLEPNFFELLIEMKGTTCAQYILLEVVQFFQHVLLEHQYLVDSLLFVLDIVAQLYLLCVFLWPCFLVRFFLRLFSSFLYLVVFRIGRWLLVVQRTLIVVASSFDDPRILIQSSLEIVLPTELICQVLFGVGLQAQFEAFLSLRFLSSAVRQIDRFVEFPLHSPHHEITWLLLFQALLLRLDPYIIIEILLSFRVLCVCLGLLLYFPSSLLLRLLQQLFSISLQLQPFGLFLAGIETIQPALEIPCKRVVVADVDVFMRYLLAFWARMAIVLLRGCVRGEVVEVVRLKAVGILRVDAVSIWILEHVDGQPRWRSRVGVHSSNNYVNYNDSL